MEFDWLDCPDLTQREDVNQPAIGAEDLSVVSFDASYKPSGKTADNNDSLATAQASVANTVDSTTVPPSASAALQGSSKLAPIDVDADDLAPMTDTIASIADTVDSTATPPIVSTQAKASPSWHQSMLMLMTWPPWQTQPMLPQNLHRTPHLTPLSQVTLLTTPRRPLGVLQVPLPWSHLCGPSR